MLPLTTSTGVAVGVGDAAVTSVGVQFMYTWAVRRPATSSPTTERAGATLTRLPANLRRMGGWVAGAI